MKKKKKKTGVDGRGRGIGFIWRRGPEKKSYIRFSLLGWPTIKCLPDVDGFSIETEQLCQTSLVSKRPLINGRVRK